MCAANLNSRFEVSQINARYQPLWDWATTVLSSVCDRSRRVLSPTSAWPADLSAYDKTAFTQQGLGRRIVGLKGDQRPRKAVRLATLAGNHSGTG